MVVLTRIFEHGEQRSLRGILCRQEDRDTPVQDCKGPVRSTVLYVQYCMRRIEDRAGKMMEGPDGVFMSYWTELTRAKIAASDYEEQETFAGTRVNPHVSV
jgi:hypothetical protein